MSGNSSLSAGHLAIASCTRFSPKTRWPAKITGRTASAENVFDTATSVTAPAGRFAAFSALPMPARTSASRATASVIRPSGVDAPGKPW